MQVFTNGTAKHGISICTQSMFTTYKNAKKSAGDKQVQEGPQQCKGSHGTEIAQIKLLDCIKKHNGGRVIYNSFSKYNTVKEWCFILI